MLRPASPPTCELEQPAPTADSYVIVLPRQAVDRTGYWTFCTVIFLLTLLLVRRAFSYSVFPDELYFLTFLRDWNANPTDTVPPNYCGYGSSWWMLLNLLYQDLQPLLHLHVDEAGKSVPLVTPATSSVYITIFAARLCSLAVLLGSVGFAIVGARPGMNRAFMAGLLLLPFVWWDGKWVSPDFFAIACAIMAGALLYRQAPLWACLFLGLAVGLRISNAPVLSGFLLLAMVGERFQWRHAATCVAVYIAGYVLANPIVIDNFDRAMVFALGVPSSDPLTWARFTELLSDCTFGEGH
jgi:hypothetical protein